MIRFLKDDWKSNDYASVIGTKAIFFNHENFCFKYEIINGNVVRTLYETLHSSHEEADSRLLYHLSRLPVPNNTVIRTNETDVLVIALGCFSSLDKTGLNVWLDMGNDSLNMGNDS